MSNVQLFHQLLHVQMDWLSDSDHRLTLLCRASKVFAHVQQQLDSFQVGTETCLSIQMYCMSCVQCFWSHIFFLVFVVLSFSFCSVDCLAHRKATITVVASLCLVGLYSGGCMKVLQYNV